MVYQKTSCRLNLATVARSKTLLWLFCFLLLTPLTASAVVVEGLFEVEMPVLDESKAIRRAALDDGLIEVLIRVSGDSNILERIKAPVGNSYVKRFEYSVQAADVPGGEASKRLWVRYNATRVLEFLRKQAIPIWGEHRSQAVIWMAVRDGSQRYILKDKDSSLIKSKTNMALSRRGIAILWPRNDARDQETVSFADIWAGFTEPLKLTSKRYSSGPVIVATMGWNGQIWKAEWSLLMDDKVRKWSLSGRDYVDLISRATDLLADVMGQKFAVLETTDVSQQKMLALEVNQVKSVEDFRRIEKYLLSLSAVKSVQLSQLESERVFFDLALRTEVDDLLNLIQSDTVMARLADEPVSDEVNDGAVGTELAENALVNPAGQVASVPQPKAQIYRFVLR